MKHRIRITAVIMLFAMLLVTAAQAAPGSVTRLTVTAANQEAGEALIDSMLNANSNPLNVQEYSEPDEDELVRVIVLLPEPSLSEQGIKDPTEAVAQKGAVDMKSAQNNLIKRIEKEVFDGKELEVFFRYSFLLNGFSIEVPFGSVKDIADVEGVGSVSVAPTIVPLETAETDAEFLDDEKVRENPTKYRGEHTAIAILDTGIEYTHPAFGTPVKNPLLTRDDVAKKIATLDFNAAKNPDFSVDTVYKSSKIPYTFDYGDMDTDASCPRNDAHGVHVAGIAAGDDSVSGAHERMNSAAPDAQLIPIKIFNSRHMSTLDMLAAAIEDCALLGVDSINMSFALVESFSSMHSMDPFSTECQNAIDVGVNIVAACGNSTNSSLMNKIGSKTYTWNPDNSITTAPASFINVLGVAADSGSGKTRVENFSSQGPNPDLVLCPEVSAYGSGVWSSYIDGSYHQESGTSMASPYAAGSIAGIRQYIREKINLNSLPTKMSLPELAKALMICTATPVPSYADQTVIASPRKQGAGHMNMEGAVTTPAYITIGDNARPVIDQIDDPGKTGVYEFEFRVNNMTRNSLSYTVEVMTMTSDVMQYKGPDGNITEYMTDYTRYLNPTVTVSNLSGDKLNVQGSGKQDVKVSITLSQSDREFLNTNYPNGGYVEGFVRLYPTDESGVALTVPYLCFYGDWTKAPIIDVGYYYDDINGNVNWSSTMNNAAYTKTGTQTLYLGDNPLHPGEVAYIPEHNAISPNGDGRADRVEDIQVGLLRNARRAGYRIWDNTTEYWSREREYVNKSYVNPADRSVQYLGTKCPFAAWRGANLPNNTTVNITTYAEVDFTLHEIKNDHSEWTIPVTIDTEAPVLVSAQLRNEGPNTYLEVITYDNQFIADVTIADIDLATVYSSSAVSETERGVQKMYRYDVTGLGLGSEFGVILTDYALNTGSFVVSSGGYRDPNVTPDPNLTVFLPGDANLDGSITAGDATLILRHVVGTSTLTGDKFTAADFNGDGMVTAGDATLVLRIVVGAK